MMTEKQKDNLEDVVNSLKSDAYIIHGKLRIAQEKNDYRACIDCMRLLKDTLSLIKEYDIPRKEIDLSDLKYSPDKWAILLNHFIKNKQSMLFNLDYSDRDVEKMHRGTGKSTTIENLAIKYDFPVFTSKHRACEYNKTMNYKQYKDKTSHAFSSFTDFRNYYIIYDKNLVLVDEGFSDYEILEDLIKNYNIILIGFRSIK